MGLDINIYKTNRKEWMEFSKGEPVDIYDTLEPCTDENGNLVRIGGAPECPNIIPLGNWRRQYEFTEGYEPRMLEFFEFPRERLIEMVDEWEKDYHDTPKYNWGLSVLNLTTEDDMFLIMFDG